MMVQAGSVLVGRGKPASKLQRLLRNAVQKITGPLVRIGACMEALRQLAPVTKGTAVEKQNI